MRSELLLPVAALLLCCNSDGFSPPLAEPARSPRRLEVLELRSRVFGNTRSLRVLLPASYGTSNRRYPVFYFTDGRAAMDPPGWDLPGAIEEMAREGGMRECIFIGIDNGGSTVESVDPVVDRASEYLPFPDPSWTDPPVPTPRGDRFPEFLLEEVAPLVESRYRVAQGPENRGIAGASFGALIALYTIERHPEAFGLALIESPSLHVGEGAIIAGTERLARWSGRLYIGFGGAEGSDESARAEMVANVRAFVSALEARAPDAEIDVVYEEAATHSYDSWRERLPRALRFLLDATGSQREAGRSGERTIKSKELERLLAQQVGRPA